MSTFLTLLMAPFERIAFARIFLRCITALLYVSLTACSFFSQDISDLGPTLADLPDPVIPEQLEPVAVVSRDEVEAMYLSALAVAEDIEVRQKIKIRLADIAMARGEDLQIASDTGGQFFDQTISMYDQLIQLQQAQKGEVDERLLYRVSKAYALDARMDESDAALEKLIAQNPNSSFAAEAQFRRAEQAFSYQDYSAAYTLYGAVVDIGDQTPFYLNALYMQGWALFKQDQYLASLNPFHLVMDKILPTNSNPESLSKSQQSLVADTLKVLGFAYSYIDGPASIATFTKTHGERDYTHLIYRQLGGLYVENKRYYDAANTYEAFIQEYPNSDFNPEFADTAIAVYLKGGFDKEILPAKETYIQRFGLASLYWQERTPAQRERYSATLESYLDEVSSYYHAQAQTLVAAQTQYANKQLKKQPASPVPSFVKAAGYYDEMLRSFPNHPRVPELTFLMAEALHDAGALTRAVVAYEQVAYEYLDPQRGASAGYAAILTLDQLLEAEQAVNDSAGNKAASSALNQLKLQRINSAISFADYYPADERAVAVLTNAAERLYSDGNKEQAIVIATRLTQWQPQQAPALQKTAWLVLAHSLYELERFSEAEASYRTALALLSDGDKDRAPVTDRIAASMYKQAEQNIADNQLPEAVDRLLSIASVAPDSTISVNAKYDAANHLMTLKDWSRAEKVLLDFQRQYPEHELHKTITPKLAVLYQETEQWGKAAAQLESMSSSESDPETRRSALYLSAELYRKSGSQAFAEKTYRAYIKRYPVPFDLALEARVQLLEMAKTHGTLRKQEALMQELITVDAKAGGARTTRSTYLAAQSQTYFAGKDLAQFESIRLRAPIKKTLKAKRKAMDKALKSYKTVIDYGVAEFATQANHRIGEVYANLYDNLLNSERPKGLDELTMEQYEIMLEEQAYPFKGKAVDMLTINAERSWDGFYDEWVKESFSALAKLLPARYGKEETVIEVSRGVR
ncbi:tetratricopeptide repeat protein [Marinagarivorans algicola]|uniref:tetratricopeptide repeat protein n=1 Tax=Marinagarivorans algicola TaxID=1513270 RepID=UPI003734F075